MAKLWEGWTGQTLQEGVGWVGGRSSLQGPLCDRELVNVCVCGEGAGDERKLVMGLGESYKVMGKGKVAQDECEVVKMCSFM